jgi:F0F1-type ATP synthase membrane subunit c/vacuolar-type H+-ATPase subunit K
MFSTLASTLAMATTFAASVPMVADQPDKTIDVLMLLLMVIQLLIGLPPTP